MSQDNNEAASADLIARQVAGWTKERNRLQDLINAASASQSSTPVPRMGGHDEAKTIDTPEFRERLRGMGAAIAAEGESYKRLVGYVNRFFLANIAPQAAADTGAASVDTPELRKLMRHYYDTASSFAGSSPADAALLAVFSHIETVYGARIRHLEHERDEARIALTACHAAVALLAQQAKGEAK